MAQPRPNPPSLRQTFAHNMRKRREELKISQELLADICALHRTYISLVERSRRNLSIDNIEKIANGLQIEPAELMLRRNYHNDAI